MHFLDELQWRGLLQDVSDDEGLRKLGSGESCYVGFDPTARSLHLGNLLPILTAMRLAKFGIKPVILFGGATGTIGDPSGKRAERQLLDRQAVDSNVAALSAQVGAIFERAGVTAEYVNNLDWTEGVTILDFLRDVGKHFTVNYMLAKESVSARMESEVGISFTEFSYMLLQAFDFYHLHRNKGVRIQFGASDQWGNITAGLELIRKKIQGEAYTFCIPLLVDSQGRKMGKSEGGALFLDPALTSPYKLHQYLLNVADEDSIRFVKIFTFLSRDEIDALEARSKAAPEKREAQRILADTVCTLVHGDRAAAAANRSAEVLFGGSMEGLADNEISDIFSEVPSYSISREKLGSMTFLDLLVTAGAVKSKGEARRLIESGGAYMNNVRVGNGSESLAPTARAASSVIVLRTGKKNYLLVKLTA